MKIIRRSWILAIVLVSMIGCPTVKAGGKAEQLRQTMADVALLNGQIAQRKADAMTIREALSAKRDAIRTEALNVMREKKIRTQADALENPRLFYDLLLMAEIDAYASRYDHKIGYYRVACDRLSYLYQQADDVLKIVDTLSDFKVDALIAQAEKVLDDYLPHAQTIVIDAATLTAESPEKMFVRLKAEK